MTTDAKKVWEAWGRASALYMAWAAGRNINSYRLFVLYAIDGNRTITQKTIAEYTGLSRQTVNTVIRTLKNEGYLELVAGNPDRREKLVRLTPQGEVYSVEMLSPLYKLETRVFDMIGAGRIKEMMNAIDLFTTVFEKEMEKKNANREA